MKLTFFLCIAVMGFVFLIRAFIRTFIWNFLNLWLSGRNYSVVLLKFTGLQFTLSICIKVTECPSLKEHTARNNQEHFRCICSTRQSYHSHMRHNYFLYLAIKSNYLPCYISLSSIWFLASVFISMRRVSVSVLLRCYRYNPKSLYFPIIKFVNFEVHAFYPKRNMSTCTVCKFSIVN